MQVKIDRLDDLGQGITTINKKVTFVPNTVPEDVVNVEIIQEKKKYNKAKLIKVINPSPLRIDAKCPYFLSCGGCQLQTMKYEDIIKYKKEKVTNIFKKNNVDISLEVISNPKTYNYRNKVSLKVVDKKFGYYEKETHKIVEIQKCVIADEVINETISLVKNFNIVNGNVTIRCNKNGEVLIIIDSKDNINIDINYIKEKIKLAGVVINKKTFYGNNYLIEEINGLLFKISYDSFFQINPYVAGKLFAIISNNIDKSDIVLDLYCGVGTLSLSAAIKANYVVGIEVVENAILNAKYNANMNKLDNTTFILNDLNYALSKIDKDFTKIIIDPPRSGLSNVVINTILKIMPKEIIYVSCDPQTLVRDYKLLEKCYEIKKAYILDMFSYTYHVECVSVLSRKAQ